MKKQTHILVAEDDFRILRTMCVILRAAGHKTTGAHTGEEALDCIEALRGTDGEVDLLVTDIQMPVMRGDELIDELHRREIDLPVVVLTGYGDKELVVDLMRRGCDEYLDKPLTATELTDRVGAVLKKKARRANQWRKTEEMASVGVLTSEIVHDFNNILGATIGFADLALENLDQGRVEAGNRQLQKLRRTAFRATGLTDRLLAYGQNREIETKLLSLGDVVDDMLDLLKALIKDGIEIKVRRQDKLWPVVGDLSALQQLIMNLAVNARDAMPEGGTLDMMVENTVVDGDSGPSRQLGNYVRMKVSDTGTGMDDTALKRIFDPFYTTKEEGKGTGLGLSVVRRAARDHGGWVDVESEPGKGTAFSVYLPAALDTHTIVSDDDEDENKSEPIAQNNSIGR